MKQLFKQIMMGVLFSIPVYPESPNQTGHQGRPILYITAGAASISVAYHTLKNVVSTAIRRLSNPEYQNNKSASAVLSQTAIILAHNRLFTAGIIGGFALGTWCIYKGIKNFLAKDKRATKRNLVL